MRATLSFLGWSLDLSLEPTTTEAAADDPATALNGGTLGSTNVLYFGRHEIPDEATIHRPCSPWEDGDE